VAYLLALVSNKVNAGSFSVIGIGSHIANQWGGIVILSNAIKASDFVVESPALLDCSFHYLI